MKKRLLPCLAVLFLLLTACGVGHMGVHALEDITDADIVANEMGYSAVLWQSYSDTFSCEASWETLPRVPWLSKRKTTAKYMSALTNLII